MIQYKWHWGRDAQQDLQNFGQVDVDEMAHFMDEHFYGVEQAVLATQRGNSRQVRLGYSSFYRGQTRSCKQQITHFLWCVDASLKSMFAFYLSAVE